MRPLLDLVPAAALVALLTTAYLHPRGRVEAAVGTVAATSVLLAGTLPPTDATAALAHLGPVVAFLASILVVGDVCARAGLFTAAAHRVVGVARGDARRLFSGVFVLAALVTAALSLDATVVLLVPVVVAATVALGVPSRPGAQACLRMANSASLLLPVSNLTNLLALHHLDLTFLGFAAWTAPLLLVVLLVEYAALRLLHRRDLAEPARDADRGPTPALPRFPLATVLLMLVAFAALSPLGVEPFWVSAAAALVLVLWARYRDLVRSRDVLAAGHPGFAVFVLCLGIVVAALAAGPLGGWVARLVPDGTGFLQLLWIAALSTVLANLLTNLSATLLLVPLLVPLGTPAVVAALVGLNVGSGLTYTGSLANLLWRRTLRRCGADPGLGEFHRVSLVVTPLAVVAAVTVLTALH